MLFDSDAQLNQTDRLRLCQSEFVMQTGILRTSKKHCLLAILLFGLLPVSVGNCQTGVQVKLSDQTLTQVVQKTNRVVLSSASFDIRQESDFEPRKTTEPDDDGLIRLDEEDMTPPKPVDVEGLDQPNQDQPGSITQEINDPTKSRDSDAPVEPPKFKLEEDSPNESSIEEPANDRGKPNNNEQYQLPPVASVNAPISLMPLSMVNQNDPGGLLMNDQNVNLNQQAVFTGMTYANVTGQATRQKFKTWQAHNFYHRPLYFEQQNVERHGNRRAFNNLASPIHFFATIPRLPYKIGEQSPFQRVYTHRQIRPGDYTQFRIQQPTESRRGNALQALVSYGIILP